MEGVRGDEDAVGGDDGRLRRPRRIHVDSDVTCWTGKTPYRDFHSANFAISLFKQKRKDDFRVQHHGLQAFRCPFCHRFHVGNANDRRSGRKTRRQLLNEARQQDED